MSSVSPRPGPVFLLVLAFSVLCRVPSLAAEPFTPVFSKQYTRPAGRPVSASDAFTVCDPRGTFRIVVLNGPGGQEQVSGGSIVVNGLEVIEAQDFKHRVARIERPLGNIRQDNRVEVRVRGRPDGAIQVTIEGIQRCLGVRITSPVPGSTIPRSPVLVRGEVNVPPGTEAGVTVNGFPALVGSGGFAALVPVEAGAQTLVARLQDAAGRLLAEDSVSVQVAPPGPLSGLFLTPAPGIGAAPLQVDLHASFLGRASNYQWDVDGNGTIDLAGSELVEVAHEYLVRGLFFPKVIVTDTQGRQFSETAPVLVFVKDEVIALLHAKWQGFKNALRAGDVAAALQFVAHGSRDRYREIFQNLTVPLAAIDQVLTDIRFVQFRDRTAEFEMLRADERGLLSYSVRFVIDEDGIWRLRSL